MTTKINHVAMEPQIARCVSHVHAFVTRPAFRQTVTTTYYRKQKKYCHRHSVMHTKNLSAQKKNKQLTHSHKHISSYNSVVVIFRTCTTAFLIVLIHYSNTERDTKNLDSHNE